MSKPQLKAYELFAGVGGFRLGLERAGIGVIWSNQWEPGQKSQVASQVYVRHFGSSGHSNEDIGLVLDKLERGEVSLPDAELLVGGFPCQDYSVAKTLSQSGGIQGKKGVLWWEIHRLLRLKKPDLILLENVDRLLTSPASQRGRDFAIMLRSLCDLDYEVEWKVINSGDYGFPQRRRRVFIFASRNGRLTNFEQYQAGNSLLERAFPSTAVSADRALSIDGELVEIGSAFNILNRASPFESSGVAKSGDVIMRKTVPMDVHKVPLRSVLIQADQVDEDFWIDNKSLEKWKELKDAKAIVRRSKSGGAEYLYKEGRMPFPDNLDASARTIVTGEGGKSPSRFKHVIRQSNRYRRLTPLELERLNGFPDDWTRFGEGDQSVLPAKRAFLMGNALVVGVVERIAKEIAKLQ